MNTTTGNSIADNQHAAMVEAILRTGGTHTSAVEQALRTVPRHAFLPGATLDQAYDPDLAVITKRAADGSALSCASVPTLVASMLEQLQVRPGDRIFECGAGTGYNAALLACPAGPDGTVTTVDIDADIAASAADALRQTGYPHVRVLAGDGAAGASRDGPFTRAIITVGAWDLPPAWWDQLAPGRLVVPLRWRGQTRAVAFVHDGYGVMRSDSVQLCGFVPMIGQDGEKTATIDPDGRVSLHWDADQDISPANLAAVLTTPRSEAWSQATVGPYDPFDGIWLRATATDPAICRIAATQAAIDSGLCTPAIASRSPALAKTTPSPTSHTHDSGKTCRRASPASEQSATAHADRNWQNVSAATFTHGTTTATPSRPSPPDATAPHPMTWLPPPSPRNIPPSRSPTRPLQESALDPTGPRSTSADHADQKS
jgi:protein-L-isoaspartate(D-aspartate) O-methyltransferase